MLANSRAVKINLGVLGLDLHSSSRESVSFFGAQSSLGGAQFSFGGHKQSFRGARPRIRRVARIWKRGGGGYFERVRKVQTTLTRILIVLESVSHGLSENSDEISPKAPKFKGFFRRKSGVLQKKKVFAEIESDFLAEIRNSKGFFRPKSGVLQKKKVFIEIETDFSAKFGNSNVSGGAVFLWGGLFSIFHNKSASKALKTCDFAYFTS